jgi:hypothetical protein
MPNVDKDTPVANHSLITWQDNVLEPSPPFYCDTSKTILGHILIRQKRNTKEYFQKLHFCKTSRMNYTKQYTHTNYLQSTNRTMRIRLNWRAV